MKRLVTLGLMVYVLVSMFGCSHVPLSAILKYGDKHENCDYSCMYNYYTVCIDLPGSETRCMKKLDKCLSRCRVQCRG